MKKQIYTLVLIAVTCGAITACGKKDDTTKAPSEQETETSAPSDAGTEPVDDETTVPAEAPSDEESETQTPAPEPDATPDSSLAENTMPPEEIVPTTGSASGTFVGFVDTHTVEIVLDDGETIPYQVKKDSVLDALQEMDENGETALSFKYKITADGDYIITKVK